MAKSYLLGILSLLAFCLTMGYIHFFIKTSEEFPEHFWLELGITFLAIFLGVILVDGFKKLGWMNLRPKIYHSLARNLLDLLDKLCIIFLPLSIYYGQTTEVFEREKHAIDYPTVETFKDISAALNDPRVTGWTVKNMSGNTITASDSAYLYVDVIKPNLDEIRFLITPIIIRHSEEEGLLDSLARFESSRRSLENSLLKSKNGLPSDIIPELSRFISISGEIYKYLMNSNILSKKMPDNSFWDHR
jgi:hypothetical protein